MLLLAIPVIEKCDNALLCSSLSKTVYILIYDVFSKEVKYVDNSACKKEERELKAIEKIAEQGADLIIVSGLSKEAKEKMASLGIKAYKSDFEYAKDNIQAFIAEKLNEI